MKYDPIQKSSKIISLDEKFTDFNTFIPWKNSFEGVNFFDWFLKLFIYYEDSSQNDQKDLYFFRNESTFAFRIHISTLNIDPSFLWIYWKDIIKENGYVLKNRQTVLKSEIETFSYYLKPKLKYKVDGEQLFGNISLDLTKRKGDYEHIMMKCTWYQDRSYKEAKPYSELVDLILRGS